ncbi:MAG: hypothetical protein JNK72_19370 [Myxococcales bacterium]|nr:hypothetical protein [Myxococcales bacterium]
MPRALVRLGPWVVTLAVATLAVLAWHVAAPLCRKLGGHRCWVPEAPRRSGTTPHSFHGISRQN